MVNQALPIRSSGRTGEQLMDHLISDNCSPEITSFTLSSSGNNELPGRTTARETSRRFFLLQLLIEYANREFRLEQYGQTCRMYLAPNPPARQKRAQRSDLRSILPRIVSQPLPVRLATGRSEKGVHGALPRTLSRSQLNTIGKLKEAGIIVNNLVVLPNTSSTSLANNGTHITLGSRMLSRCYREPDGGPF